ncbi:hypothetical protein SCT_3203 [Sulfuricella sp. T08]|uniref:YqjK-like family protein n=1 Tax=Sulfuricella sp. T08 TaxID=1632857 RepID=UPI0006179835|nr:YqjK-like family protein [Sulfuricella sp. T08]GAO37766.1 hypothetical protein SCT_3203 [Sulfuricella sp. T08]
MEIEQRLDDLSRRRAELVARSAAQRAELGDIGHAWRLPLAIADQGVTVWRFFRMYPALLVGLGVVFAVARPRRAVKWFGRGWALWRFFRGMAAGQGKHN